jgi:hypothetical protein
MRPGVLPGLTSRDAGRPRLDFPALVRATACTLTARPAVSRRCRPGRKPHVQRNYGPSYVGSLPFSARIDASCLLMTELYRFL